MTTAVKLPPGMPNRMKQLPKDDVGRPVPFFVEWIDGKPDFRIMSGDHFRAAVMRDLCWLCGLKLNRHQGALLGTFVAGPMCLINRTSAEPPCHDDCADWSARACPFLNNPNKVRREGGLPEGAGLQNAAGIAIARNPGVTALIESRRWAPWTPEEGGLLFNFSWIRQVKWIKEGRDATGDEIMFSIETGLPALYEMAESQGPDTVRYLGRHTREALKWVPMFEADEYPLVRQLVNTV